MYANYYKFLQSKFDADLHNLLKLSVSTLNLVFELTNFGITLYQYEYYD